MRPPRNSRRRPLHPGAHLELPVNRLVLLVANGITGDLVSTGAFSVVFCRASCFSVVPGDDCSELAPGTFHSLWSALSAAADTLQTCSGSPAKITCDLSP